MRKPKLSSLISPRVLLLLILVALSMLLALMTATPSAARGVIAGADAAAAARWNGDEIRWRSAEGAFDAARRSGKPLFVQVHAPWCAQCGALADQFRDRRVVGLARRYVMVLVDAEREPAIAARLAPDGPYVPRSLVLMPDGALARNVDADAPSYAHAIDASGPKPLRALLREGLAYKAASPKHRAAWPDRWRRRPALSADRRWR